MQQANDSNDKTAKKPNVAIKCRTAPRLTLILTPITAISESTVHITMLYVHLMPTMTLVTMSNKYVYNVVRNMALNRFGFNLQTTDLDRRKNSGVDEQLFGIFLMSCCDVRDEPFLSMQQHFSERRRHLTLTTSSSFQPYL